MKRFRSWTGLFLLLALLPVPLAGQGGYFRVSGADLLADSRLIFVGKLVAQESFWSEDGRFILTRHVFQVEEAVKGEPGKRAEIIEYGGTVGDRTMTVSHGARYSRGGEYLIFSSSDEANRNRTLGGPLGRLPVISDGTGQRSVRIYSSHPLLSVLGGEAEPGLLLRSLPALSGRLRTALEEARRTGK